MNRCIQRIYERVFEFLQQIDFKVDTSKTKKAQQKYLQRRKTWETHKNIASTAVNSLMLIAQFALNVANRWSNYKTNHHLSSSTIQHHRVLMPLLSIHLLLLLEKQKINGSHSSYVCLQYVDISFMKVNHQQVYSTFLHVGYLVLVG